MTGTSTVLWNWMEKGFRRGRLIEDEDLPTASWCLEQVFARLETCMPSWTATDLLYALGQISLTSRVWFSHREMIDYFTLLKSTWNIYTVNTHITAIMQAYKQNHGVKPCLFSLLNNSKEFAFLNSCPNQPLWFWSFTEKTTELAMFFIKGRHYDTWSHNYPLQMSNYHHLCLRIVCSLEPGTLFSG